MSDTTALKGLASAIRKIAWQPDEIRSNLRALRAVGILPEVIATNIAGEDNDPDGEDDTPTGEPGEGAPGDPDAGTIDGERPDDGSTEKGMDGTFRMPDGTFAPWDDQPCTPDETWAEGEYWVADFGGRLAGATATAAATAALNNIFPMSHPGCGQENWTNLNLVAISPTLYIVYIDITKETCSTTTHWNQGRVGRGLCGSSTADYCQLTTAPCTEDQDWQPDGKCQEALINGAFIPHPKDPDCAGRAPQHYQIMCEGERCVAYVPTADGGHMRVDLDENGLPQGDVRFYGADGKYSDSRSYSKTNFRNNAYDSSTLPQEWVR